MTTHHFKFKPIHGIILGVVFLALLAVGIGSVLPESSGKLDGFAQCLSDNGAKMYGAYWCGHCANQKKLFGVSWKNVNYIECSLPNRAGTQKICTDEKIEGYPEWHFRDGSKLSGEIPLDALASKTGCKLP